MTVVAPPAYGAGPHHIDVERVDALLAGPLALPASASLDAGAMGPLMLLPPGTDGNSAQNIALKVQLAAMERELAQCRHALDKALAQAGNWGALRHRVVLGKPLSATPARVWAGAAAAPRDADQDAAARVISDLQRAVDDKAQRLAAAEAALGTLRQSLEDAQRRAAEAEVVAARLPAIAPTGGAPGEKGAASSEAAVSHLMAQVWFLHGEVERLEGVVKAARDGEASAFASRASQFAREIEAREAKILALQQTVARLKGNAARGVGAAQGQITDAVDDVTAALQQLERELRDANAAKAEALAEKYALAARVRKLEERARVTRVQSTEAAKDATDEATVAASQLARAHEALARVTRERDALATSTESRRAADAARRLTTTAVQCEQVATTAVAVATERYDPIPVHVGCQVNLGGGSSGAASLAPFAVGAGGLAQSLEQKCNEIDVLRAALEEAQMIAERQTSQHAQTRAALAAEVDVRKALDAEVEQLRAQARALHQQTSQLQVLLRDRNAAVAAADERAEAAQADAVKLSQERQEWERQLGATARDFDQLVAQKTAAMQQVAAATGENQALHDEVQKLLQREAQLAQALRSKDGELAEVLGAYQLCVQEHEAAVATLRSAEKDVRSLRTVVAQSEERIVEFQREVNNLHQREQQLITDLQSCDYENGMLHRRLVQAEGEVQEATASATGAEQQALAQRRLAEEHERVQAELHKQLLLRDNEIALLRRRCDMVEQEFTALRAAATTERTRLRELEDTNARLAVSHILHGVGATDGRDASVAAAAAARAAGSAESDALRRELDSKRAEAAALASQLADVQRDAQGLRVALAERTVQMEQQGRVLAQMAGLVDQQDRALRTATEEAASSANEPAA